MDKPLTIAIDELRQGIAEAINSCQLHAFIIDRVVQEISAEIHQQAEMQSQRERMEYSQSEQETEDSE